MLRLIALTGLLLAPCAASAQIESPTMLPDVGQVMDVQNGSSLRLDAAVGPEGVVVAFWSTACPWADRYAPRLQELIEGYAPAGVGFVLVAEGTPADTTGGVGTTRRRPAAAGLSAPYVADADGTLRAALGARSAPHVFFFGPDRTLVYDGAIDDSPADADRVQVSYLRQAMDQSIAGIPVEITRTQAFGCTIRERP